MSQDVSRAIGSADMQSPPLEDVLCAVKLLYDPHTTQDRRKSADTFLSSSRTAPWATDGHRSEVIL